MPQLPAAWYYDEKRDAWELISLVERATHLTCTKIAYVRHAEHRYRWAITAEPTAHGYADSQRQAILAVEHLMEPTRALILRSPTHPPPSRIHRHTLLLGILCTGPKHSDPADLTTALAETQDLLEALIRAGYTPSDHLRQIQQTLKTWNTN